MVAMLNSFTMYKPYTVFLSIGGFFFVLGLIPFIHYLYLVLTVKNPNGAHHLQSLVIGAVLLNASFVSVTLGIVANLIRVNRSLLEDTLEVIKREQFMNQSPLEEASVQSLKGGIRADSPKRIARLD
jgi:uncharacterized membrane protein